MSWMRASTLARALPYVQTLKANITGYKDTFDARAAWQEDSNDHQHWVYIDGLRKVAFSIRKVPNSIPICAQWGYDGLTIQEAIDITKDKAMQVCRSMGFDEGRIGVTEYAALQDAIKTSFGSRVTKVEDISGGGGNLEKIYIDASP